MGSVKNVADASGREWASVEEDSGTETGAGWGPGDASWAGGAREADGISGHESPCATAGSPVGGSVGMGVWGSAGAAGGTGVSAWIVSACGAPSAEGCAVAAAGAFGKIGAAGRGASDIVASGCGEGWGGEATDRGCGKGGGMVDELDSGASAFGREWASVEEDSGTETGAGWGALGAG
jgi:hypothetical protein